MEASKFKEIIEKFTDKDSVSVNLDFIVHEEDAFKIFSTEPNTALKEKLVENFTKKLNALTHLKDLELLDIYDDNGQSKDNILYYDDLEKNDIAKSIFSYKNSDKTVYEHSKHKFSTLFGIIIEIDNGSETIRLFKKNYSVRVVQHSTGMNLLMQQGNVKMLEQDILQLNDKIHLMCYNQKIFILAKTVYTDNFGVGDILANNGEVALAEIDSIGSFEITDRVKDKVGKLSQTMLKKLKNVVDESPIYKSKDFNDFERQALEYGGRQIKINESGQFRIKSKDDLIILIKFLNREFNKNEATGEVFETPTKKLVK